MRTRVSRLRWPGGPAVLLAALLLEHADFLALVGAVDHAHDHGAVDEGRAGEHLARVLADEQDLVERHGVAGLAGVAVDGNDRAGLDAELVAGGLDNRKHGSSPLEWARPGRRFDRAQEPQSVARTGRGSKAAASAAVGSWAPPAGRRRASPLSGLGRADRPSPSATVRASPFGLGRDGRRRPSGGVGLPYAREARAPTRHQRQSVPRPFGPARPKGAPT